VGGSGDLFGTVLRRFRRRAGLTQERLADRAGLSANAISALERGERRRPYPHTVGALAQALGLTADEHAELAALSRSVPVAPRADDRAATAPPTASPALPVPRQLPAASSDFIGRDADLARLDALLEAAGAGTAPSVVIAVIAGTAGVGKTTLAVMWAHRVRDRFPDGQLYVNLRGYDPGPPATSTEVLDGFLRALDVPADRIPPSLEQRAALFRSLVDDRRILVLLDNANSAEQVRPLLPGSSSSMVVVTSRDSLTGLTVSAGAARVRLDLLRFADAVTLLRGIVGERRAAAEPRAVAELARLCARLPLALQLGGQRVAARPDLPLAGLAADLADESECLDLLSSGADEFTAARAVFSWSYRNLADPQARLFRLLGLHPGPDIGPHAAAALAGIPPSRARVLLDALVDAHLVEVTGAGRFRMHDLLRAYAREQVAGTEDVGPGFDRLAGFYLHATAAADHRLHPGRQRTLVDSASVPAHPITFADYDEALRWCEGELTNFVAVTRTAAERGLHGITWQLANNLWSFFYLTKHRTEWVEVYRIGLAAADRSGDLGGLGRMHNGLAGSFFDTPRTMDAVDHLRRGLDLFRSVDDRWGVGSVLGNLGGIYLRLNRCDDAIAHFEQALKIFREISNPYFEGINLGNLGETYLALHRYHDAVVTFMEVLDLCRQINHRYGEGLTLIHLGEGYAGLRRYEQAVEHLTQGLNLCRDNGDRHSQALALRRLGCVYQATGDVEAARRHWREAADIFAGLGDVQADEVRGLLRSLDDEPRRRGRRAGSGASTVLTPAEWRIAGLAASGLTNREVAAIAYVSPKTVEANLSRVYGKLGVRNRTELAKVMHASEVPAADRVRDTGTSR
jgi:DNA-binding CsgD family transcriptional regulator/transcriptional regulator with XRE-family HTH domain